MDVSNIEEEEEEERKEEEAENCPADAAGIRTRDLSMTSPALYQCQLSYPWSVRLRLAKPACGSPVGASPIVTELN